MTAVTQNLEKHLLAWPEDTRLLVENIVSDVILWGEASAADLMRSRDLEQEVLDILDAS